MKYQDIRFPIVLASLLIALTLGACSQPETQNVDVPEADIPEIAAYQVTPEKDGTYTVTQDGVQVGGSEWIPYSRADEVNFAAYFDTKAAAADRASVEEILRYVWAQRLGPGVEPDHTASSSTVADLEDSIVTDQGGETHYLFADEDQIYDAWFQDGALSSQQIQAVLDSALPENLG